MNYSDEVRGLPQVVQVLLVISVIAIGLGALFAVSFIGALVSESATAFNQVLYYSGLGFVICDALLVAISYFKFGGLPTVENIGE
ncbi:MAG: hypothetical protein ABEK59_04720 [Halobacteria archaeon]